MIYTGVDGAKRGKRVKNKPASEGGKGIGGPKRGCDSKSQDLAVDF